VGYVANMPRGFLLSDVEKGEILALQSECYSLREIANKIKRSVGAVHSFVRQKHLHKPRRKVSKNSKNVTDSAACSSERGQQG